MGFMDAVRHVLQNYATFSGRARRSEYWFFVLFNGIIAAVLSALAQAGDGSRFFTALSSLWSLAMFLPSLAVTWRRLHDIGKSGANWCWNFLPVVGQILLLVWLCRDGEPTTNQYGPDPKGRGGFPSGGYSAPGSYPPVERFAAPGSTGGTADNKLNSKNPWEY